MQGVPTDADKEQEFREHYLLTGNARKSARLVGIPENTAKELARRANADPIFAQARTELRARLNERVPDLAEMLIDSVEVASDRISDDEWCTQFKGSDPGPQYIRACSDALKQISALNAEPEDKPGGPAVIVNLNVDPNKASE